MDDTTISLAGPDRVDELRELGLALHHHHHQIAEPGIARRARCVGRTWLTSWRACVVVEDRGTTWIS
jgi:hypothetical protein